MTGDESRATWEIEALVALVKAQGMELALHREMVRACLLVLGGCSVLFGLLLAASGPDLPPPYFASQAGRGGQIAGWPYGWATAIAASGLVTIAGYVARPLVVARVGLYLIALWSGVFVVGGVSSGLRPHVDAWAWYPTAMYLTTMSGAVVLLVWTNKIAVMSRG